MNEERFCTEIDDKEGGQSTHLVRSIIGAL